MRKLVLGHGWCLLGFLKNKRIPETKTCTWKLTDSLIFKQNTSGALCFGFDWPYSNILSNLQHLLFLSHPPTVAPELSSLPATSRVNLVKVLAAVSCLAYLFFPMSPCLEFFHTTMMILLFIPCHQGSWLQSHLALPHLVNHLLINRLIQEWVQRSRRDKHRSDVSLEPVPTQRWSIRTYAGSPGLLPPAAGYKTSEYGIKGREPGITIPIEKQGLGKWRRKRIPWWIQATELS